MKDILVSIVVLPKESHQHNATQAFAKEVNDNFGNLVAKYKAGESIEMNECANIRINIINNAIFSKYKSFITSSLYL